MRKLLTAFLSVILIFCLVGCGDSTSSADTSSADTSSIEDPFVFMDVSVDLQELSAPKEFALPKNNKQYNVTERFKGFQPLQNTHESIPADDVKRIYN